MQLRLHNTLTRTKEVFQPIDPSRVRLYVCGPTVYQRIHVGNARAFVVFDVLYRLLRHLYGEAHIVYVRNITDIDDKIIDQAQKNGEDIRALTERTTADFHADLAALGCLPPTHEPRATDHVLGMIALIAILIERGHAYAADGHVLFAVPSMPAYGRLSGRNRDEQIAGAEFDIAPYKRDPADFVLWKPSTGDQPGWDSPWGHGRPGWHIECSAMSEHFLGPLPFDIHAGGLDLIFPHHENEIAQSCCAHGLDTMARFWLHNGFLDMRGEKMSKSLGNVLRVSDVVDYFDLPIEQYTEVLRLLLLDKSYRAPLSITKIRVNTIRATLRRFYTTINRFGVNANVRNDVRIMKGRKDFWDVILNDINTWGAVSILHVFATRAFLASSDVEAGRWSSLLHECARPLGILNGDPAVWLKGGLDGPDPETIAVLIEQRMVARVAKDFDLADNIRARLNEQGVVLEDRPDGTTDWRRA